MNGARFFVLVLTVLAAPAMAGAQAKPTASPVPKEQLPPKGLCRVWVENVPASRQPAPTDCASAVRNRPPNARVLFPVERATPPRPAAKPAPKATREPVRPSTRAARPPVAKDTTARRKPPTTRPPA